MGLQLMQIIGISFNLIIIRTHTKSSDPPFASESYHLSTIPPSATVVSDIEEA